MAFQYCIECGHKMTFTTKKPKFCSGCGVQLSEGLGEARVSEARADQPHNEADGTSGPGELPDISRLQYDIEFNSGAVKLGEIIGTAAGAPAPRTSKGGKPTKPRTQKEIIAESTSECGSSRISDIDAQKA